jgi:predicted GIY-YIG superfamily endonuclease
MTKYKKLYRYDPYTKKKMNESVIVSEEFMNKLIAIRNENIAKAYNTDSL